MASHLEFENILCMISYRCYKIKFARFERKKHENNNWDMYLTLDMVKLPHSSLKHIYELVPTHYYVDDEWNEIPMLVQIEKKLISLL